ncbi:MAG: DNRLRE domain-containing protein [bacterium]|nr:DNRLRE domain-containing protein [bacterium]
MMRSRTPLSLTVAFLASAGLSILMSAQARAVEITTADGIGADAHIRSGVHEDDNFGTEGIVETKSGGANGDNYRKGYYRFDLSSLSGTISSATLTLVSNVASTFNPASDHTYAVYGLNDGTSKEGWDESMIDWTDAPAHDPNVPHNPSLPANTVTADATLLGTITVAQNTLDGDLQTFSGIALVNFLASDTDDRATLILIDTTPLLAGQNFASKETAASAPKLTVLTAIPALPLLGMAALVGSMLAVVVVIGGRARLRVQ